MKTNLVAILILCCGFSTFAQITITNNDIAPVGTTIYIAYDSVAGNVLTPGVPGANQIWDFATLIAHTTDTVSLMLPVNTPYGDNFPLSNFAVGIESDDQYAYFNRSSSMLSNVGIAANTEEYGFVTASIVPPNIYLDFPVNYGNSRNEAYSMEVRIADNTVFGVDSIKYKTSTIETLMVDAWGTMILPIGTFEVLRQREEKTVIDSAWTRFFSNWILISTSVDEIDTYNWWTNDVGAGFTLCSIDTDPSTQEVTSVSFLNSYTVGEFEIADNQIKCFPNPATDQLTMTFPASAIPLQIKLRTISGALVDVPVTKMSGSATLQISDLPSGTYFISMDFGNGNQIIRKVVK